METVEGETMTDRFMIFWSWMPRARTPQQICDCMTKSVEALSSIDPMFHDWKVTDLVDLMTRRGIATRMPPAKNAAMGEPSAGKGFMVLATDNVSDWPYGSALLCANSTKAVRLGMCGCAFKTPDSAALNSVFTTSVGLKSIALSLVPIWDAAFAQIYPQALSDKTARVFRPSWMVYLGPELAKQVTPPSDILAESTENGGLLLSATEEMFDLENPAHMAAADSLLKALAPINR